MESLVVTLASCAGVVLLLQYNYATVPVAAGCGVAFFVLGTIVHKIGRALIYPFYFSKLRNVPGPKDNQFLVGQAIRLLKADGPNDLFLEWVRKWPDAPFIRYLSFGNSEVLLVNSLEAAREVLQVYAYSFVKPSFQEKLVGEMMGTGLLFGVGEPHRRLRRITAGPLSKPNVRKMLPIFQDKAKELSDMIDKAIEGEDKGVVEVESLFNRTAFEQSYKGILDPPFLGKLIMFINPVIPLRWLPIEANLAFIRANTSMRTMLAELIQERVQQVRLQQSKEKVKGGTGDEKPDKKDFLTNMIEANLSESKGVSEQVLIDTVVQCISAGHETTAGTLTWITHALTMYPEIQKRLRQEIVSAQQKQPELSAAAIDSIPYLNNVVSESLRVYAPALSAPWETGEDVVIAGVAIPKGTTVTTVIAMIHHNPSIWGADVEVFNPDRWDAVTGAVANPFAIEAFINGPRTCLSHFHLEAVSDAAVEYVHPALTLKPRGGLKIRMQRL